MKWSSLVVAALCLVAPGCGNEPSVVSDFKAPRFQGLVVRDHPNGAEVVNSPEQEAIMPGLSGARTNVQRFSL